MSGHKSRRNNLTTRTPDAQAISQLDQLAAAVADARAQPNMVALAGMEEGFLNAYLQGSPFGNALDPLTVGAAWMIVGNLFASHINTMPEDQRSGPAQLANLARLAGQRLYTGDRLPVTLACPYTHATGAPCTTTRTGSTQEQADKLMGAHVWQNHPDKTWPPAEAEDDAEEDVASAVNLAPTDPAAQVAAMRDLETEFPDGGEGNGLSELIDRATRGGQCPECDGWVYLEDGRIGFHPTGEDGNLRTCPGAGREPKADGWDEG